MKIKTRFAFEQMGLDLPTGLNAKQAFNHLRMAYEQSYGPLPQSARFVYTIQHWHGGGGAVDADYQIQDRDIEFGVSVYVNVTFRLINGGTSEDEITEEVMFGRPVWISVIHHAPVSWPLPNEMDASCLHITKPDGHDVPANENVTEGVYDVIILRKRRNRLI